eukprot:CAMPEP_0174725570 /NCGR_PEP_ID=MMETSP1094-20130205/45928_1 /TAXON_ID=156173 /ORGANISM="Chrysochromulina brevifilum, Strain UTEX LB 985" /LENGTH=41 /DNA_ID= /DNA_START= /DNA_END= /DNA_ORIENTATION=
MPSSRVFPPVRPQAPPSRAYRCCVIDGALQSSMPRMPCELP